jgi:hypothetical protein
LDGGACINVVAVVPVLHTFNAAVLVAATAVASTSGHGALVFALEAVAALLNVAVLGARTTTTETPGITCA